MSIAIALSFDIDVPSNPVSFGVLTSVPFSAKRSTSLGLSSATAIQLVPLSKSSLPTCTTEVLTTKGEEKLSATYSLKQLKLSSLTPPCKTTLLSAIVTVRKASL